MANMITSTILQDTLTFLKTEFDKKVNSSTLQSAVADLKSAIDSLPFVVDYANIPIIWTRTDKYYSKINGNSVSQNYYYQFSIPVTEGEIYILTGTNDYNKAIYATLNSSDVAVRYYSTGNSGVVSDIEITIESGETTLVLQSNANDRATCNLKKYTSLSLDDAVVGKNNLKDDVLPLLPETQFVNLFNQNDEDVVTGKYIDRSGVLHDESVFCVSGFIPIEQNVQYQFPVYANYFGDSQVVYVPFYNSNKTYISFVTGTYDNSTQLLTVTFANVNARYTRINFVKINTYLVNTVNHNPEVMMFAKAPYPAEFIPYGDQSYFEGTVYLNEQNMQNGNPLFRKSAIFLGDSICNGGSANDGKNGWAGRIGRKNQMLWKNFGISGATFTAGLTGSAGVISEQPIDDAGYSGTPDYIIIEGGTNDADLIGSIIGGNTPEKFGSFNVSDYTSDFSNATYCGAIEYLIKKAVTERKGCKIGVIIAQKMGQLNATYTDYTAEHYNRRAYFETLMQICRKWGVPYLNLWDECYLNPMIPAHYTQGEQYMYTDGQHLTSNGYAYITPIIENWMKTL